MSYKGYLARIEYSDEDGCLVGHLAGITDTVGFHGESVAEMRAAFEQAVDDYLATCRRVGRPPQRPFSGRLLLRVPPELHARAAMRAAASGKSLNRWICDLLAQG
jgi:predicted HicB family RNase H-like nuclease